MTAAELAEKLEVLADYAERRELEINTSPMRQAAARLRSALLIYVMSATKDPQ